jgi:hypothetical protein
MKNDSIDKLAEEYASTDNDQQAYNKALSSTIISQTKEINNLKRETEKLAKENERLLMENAQLKALAPQEQGQFATSDEETICVVQLAILKNTALTRELTLEETKKTEIYVKTLKEIRGKKVMAVDEEEKVEKLSNEDLLKLMESVNKVGN